MTIAPTPAPWGMLAASVVVLVGVTEWMNRSIPTPNVRGALRWLWAHFRPVLWIDRALGAMGRVILFLRTLSIALADCVPAMAKRMRERWCEYALKAEGRW